MQFHWELFFANVPWRFLQQSQRHSRMAVIIGSDNNKSYVAWWLLERFRWGSWWRKMEAICLLKAGLQLRGFSNPEFCELTQRNGDLKVHQFCAHLQGMQSNWRNMHFTPHYLTECIKRGSEGKQEGCGRGCYPEREAETKEKQIIKMCSRLWSFWWLCVCVCLFFKGSVMVAESPLKDRTIDNR